MFTNPKHLISNCRQALQRCAALVLVLGLVLGGTGCSMRSGMGGLFGSSAPGGAYSGNARSTQYAPAPAQVSTAAPQAQRLASAPGMASVGSTTTQVAAAPTQGYTQTYTQAQTGLASPQGITTMQAMGNGSGVVAMLLPLSGELSRFGQEMKNALELARGNASGYVNVQVFDTMSTEQGAAYAAQQALQAGAGMIFGPLRGSSTPSVVQQAMAQSVPVVSFSNDMNQLRSGGVIGGMTPADSVSQILAFAGQQGRNRIIVLAPSNTYGFAAAQAAQSAAPTVGVMLVDTIYYDPGRNADERNRAAKEAASLASQADAILIPEGSARLKEVASLLNYHQVDFSKIKLLGTDIWDGSSLGDERSLNGAWYAAPASSQLSQFQQNFRSKFGATPSEPAALAYEAYQIAEQMAQSYGGFSSQALAQGQFSTIFGMTRFQNGQVAKRSLGIKQVGSSGKQIVAQVAPEVPLPINLAPNYGTSVAASGNYGTSSYGGAVTQGYPVGL